MVSWYAFQFLSKRRSSVQIPTPSHASEIACAKVTAAEKRKMERDAAEEDEEEYEHEKPEAEIHAME